MPHNAVVVGDLVVLDIKRPMRERVQQVCAAWIVQGRGRDSLVTGKAFFAVYLWCARHKVGDPASPGHDADLAEFVAASYAFIGGPPGWQAMLNERTVCRACGVSYRLENIRLCTGCMRYSCYQCGGHDRCAGELVG